MRVVVDTNVVISGMLSAFGPPGQILRAALAGKLTLLLDARLLAEYREVAARGKFPFSPEETDLIIAGLFDSGELIAAPPCTAKLPDPDDVMFYEVAVTGKADYLITGNLKHFPLARPKVHIVTPRQFIDLPAVIAHLQS